jgi:hypothetical protein
MLDEELRDQLADWAHSVDRLPVPDVAILRGRVRRRRLRVGGAIAGLAVVTAVTAGVATLPAAKPANPPVAWYPAGPVPAADAGPEAAPYFITLAGGLHDPVTVTAWRSGKQIAEVWPPTRMGTFVGVAAAADDRTFVLEEDGSNTKPTAFYELRLRPDGHPLPLTRLAIPAATMAKVRSAASPNPLLDPVEIRGVPPFGLTNSFAISPDARNLAVAVAAGGQAAIDVVSLPTGRFREWRVPNGTGPLAWAGDRYLTFFQYRDNVGLVVLDTASDSAPRVIVRPIAHVEGVGRGFAFFSSLVSADGSTLFTTYFGADRKCPGGYACSKMTIIQISLRTGELVREILPPIRFGVRGPFCAALWSDPSGRRVAVSCGNKGELDGLEQGIVSDGKFRSLSLHLPGDLVLEIPPGDFVAW